MFDSTAASRHLQGLELVNSFTGIGWVALVLGSEGPQGCGAGSDGVRTVTATEASRTFASLLDEAERGQTVVVTRGGRRIAGIGPANASNAAEVVALLREPAPTAWAAD